MSNDFVNDLVDPVVPGSKEVPEELVKIVEEAGFGVAVEMANYDRKVVEEVSDRVTMQITPEGGGKFTTLTFVVPRTQADIDNLKEDIETAIAFGQKYGKKE